MSTDHLRWHLLREVNLIALEKIRHQDDFYRCLHWQDYNPSNNPALPKLNYLCAIYRFDLIIMSTVQLKWHLLKEVSQLVFNSRRDDSSQHLGTLFLSGQGPAQVVRMILSQHVRLTPAFNGLDMELVGSNKGFFSNSPIFIKKLALRWTRILEISDEQTNFNAKVPDDVLPLLLDNCVEKLQLSLGDSNRANSFVISIVKACSNMSILSGSSSEVLLFVVERAKRSFSKVHTIEMSNFRAVWSTFLTYLTEHPEQFPALHTLTVSTKYDLELFSESFHNYSFPTVKSINIQSCNNFADCCTAIDFSKFESICTSFPNLENASLTLRMACYHDRNKLDDVYKAFETFNPKVVFALNYELYHNTSPYDTSHLELWLATKGRITSSGRVNHYQRYVVATTYPNKTMTLQMNVLNVFSLLSSMTSLSL